MYVLSGLKIVTAPGSSAKPAFFDTFCVDVSKVSGGANAVMAAAAANGVNVRFVDDKTVGISFGEAITREDTINLLKAFKVPASALGTSARDDVIPDAITRRSDYLTHPVFNT